MNRIEFVHCHEPQVSVLITAWRQRRLLEACLTAVRDKASTTIPFEVVIALNGASTDVEEFVRSQVHGAQVVPSRVNLGFAGGNNRAAEIARGKYLVLLNDDAIVETGWLDWLVATADANPRAGAVASCILFPDGRIQEAGSVIFNDGSTLGVGRGCAGNSLDWQFVRPIDYGSACSLLVRRATWNAVGGLDEGYFPAYYEDVDLCLAIRARGETVLYEPRSRVRHHESASSDERFKVFVSLRNRRRLVEKWSEELAFYEPPAPWSTPAVTRAIWRTRGCPRRVLVVDDLIPHRSAGSGFGRMFDALIEFAENGYATALHPLREFTPLHDTLVSKGVAVVTQALSAHLARPEVFYEIVIVSRPYNFEKVEAIVRRHQPWARLIYDVEALYWRRLERQAALAVNGDEAGRLRSDADQMRGVEERILRQSDYAVAVSVEEVAVLRSLEGLCPIDVLFPTEPNVAFTGRAFRERTDCGFVAGWLAGATSPNADGLRWFATAVMPYLRARLPWLRVRVTGANVPEEVRLLEDSNLRFEGHVEDLAAFYNEVRAIIVPIRFGAGVKLKTVEALQHGVPIVSTLVGAEGIDAQGLDAIDLTDDAEQFAERVAVLLTNHAVWQQRRTAIAELLRRWQEPRPCDTWARALEKALSIGRRPAGATRSDATGVERSG